MSNCSVLVGWIVLLAAVATTVVGLKIDGDPVFAVSRKTDWTKTSPRVLIQVWAEDNENLEADIVTNKIPQQKNKTQTSLRRKLVPNYDFSVVPVVTGKPVPSPQPVFHVLCRRPPYRPAWSWKLWFRGQTAGHRQRTVFEVDDKLGLPSKEKDDKKKPEIGDKLGEGIEDITSEEEDEEGVVEEVIDEPIFKARAKQVFVVETPEGVVDEEITT